MSILKFLSASMLLIAFSCKTETHEDKNVSQSYELGSNGKDTINLIDSKGLRQGIWIEHPSKDTLVYMNDTGFSAKTITTGEIIRRLKTEGGAGIMFFHDSLNVKNKE